MPADRDSSSQSLDYSSSSSDGIKNDSRSTDNLRSGNIASAYERIGDCPGYGHSLRDLPMRDGVRNAAGRMGEDACVCRREIAVAKDHGSYP